jgi:hypothetical protein
MKACGIGQQVVKAGILFGTTEGIRCRVWHTVHCTFSFGMPDEGKKAATTGTNTVERKLAKHV